MHGDDYKVNIEQSIVISNETNETLIALYRNELKKKMWEHSSYKTLLFLRVLSRIIIIMCFV
jgi:hypothetical protein